MSTPARISNIYQQRYGEAAIRISAPGRFNLIGEHTDYNLGLVMPGAIDKCLYFALGDSLSAGEVRLYAIDFEEEAAFSLQGFEVGNEVSWGNYVKAVIAELLAAGYDPGSLCGVFGGDIPVGAGLSSSAALCCGLIFGISEMRGWSIPRKQIALMAQAAEHRIGLNCGLMDQYASLFGKAGHLLRLDCKTLDFEHIPLHLQNHALFLFDSRIKHALAADSGYNERRSSCERVAAHIAQFQPGIESLRDIDAATLEAHRDALDPTDYRRAAFVLHENERVLRSAEALQHDDITELARLLNEAQKGLREEYEVTAPETDLLADLALSTPGVLGARQVGGGFGGCVLVLVEGREAEPASASIAAQYEAKTGLKPSVYPIRTGEGVSVTP